MVNRKVIELFKRRKGPSVTEKTLYDEDDCLSTPTLTATDASLPKCKSETKSIVQSGSEDESAPDDVCYSLTSTLVDYRSTIVDSDSHDISDQLEIPANRRSIDYENIAAMARIIQYQEEGIEKCAEHVTCPWPSKEIAVKSVENTMFDSNHDLKFPVRGCSTFLDDPNFLDIINLKQGIRKDGDNFIRKNFDGDDNNNNNNNQDNWLRSWDRIVNNYRPEVWGDFLPTVEAAKQEMMTFTRDDRWFTGTITVNQLQTVLDRLQTDQALHESRLRYISEERRKVRIANRKVQTHVDFSDFGYYEKAKAGISVWRIMK